MKATNGNRIPVTSAINITSEVGRKKGRERRQNEQRKRRTDRRTKKGRTKRRPERRTRRAKERKRKRKESRMSIEREENGWRRTRKDKENWDGVRENENEESGEDARQWPNTNTSPHILPEPQKGKDRGRRTRRAWR